MIERVDIDQGQRVLEALGEPPVSVGGFGDPGWMIVNEDY